ncbi:hypothetical protein [Micromonospora sp. CB01531]|uniref:hypothetical protein n=1 Tax=Micromonospora sp. CB01531 TaxID=1718947 RepID=UPI00093A2161|nr:hypothetical protein [Micromonospora sp. CB01531]OKI77060.1 hypothetical protein A6A27_40675 [Micromonospora sp. CB01531]
MHPPVWAATTALAAVLLAIAGWRMRRRVPRELTREERLAAARQAARGIRRDSRRAGPGLSTTDSAQPGCNWGSYSGGPPSDVN